MGATAIVAAAIAVRQPTTEAWLAVWLAEALVAVTLALVAMHLKASKLGTQIMSLSGRRLFIGLLPALFAGGIMTVALAVWKMTWFSRSCSPTDSSGLSTSLSTRLNALVGMIALALALSSRLDDSSPLACASRRPSVLMRLIFFPLATTSTPLNA